MWAYEKSQTQPKGVNLLKNPTEWMTGAIIKRSSPITTNKLLKPKKLMDCVCTTNRSRLYKGEPHT